MNKNAAQLESELNQTDSRIRELETERSKQTASFEGVQQAFVSGKTGVDELHAEQSKLTLVSQAIEALKTTYQKLKSAFERQSIEERRGELLKQMTDAANAVEPLVDDYRRARSEFGLIAAQHAEILVAKAEAYRTKQLEYRAIINELQPTDEEIEESKVDQRTRTLASTSHINHAPLVYGEAVALAENLLAAKLDTEARAKRIASAKARQAAN
jgi:DNA repair exonuclease SbcCD ATPase subunit